MMEQLIGQRFAALLTEVNAGLLIKPSRVVNVVPGNQIVWDDCCLGQLTARLVSMTPELTSSSSMAQCGIKFWRAVGELTLLRCALSIDDQGNAPAPHALNEEGLSAIRDSDVMLKALAKQDWITSISNWTPQGPNAGCRGISINFNFLLDQPS